jgi:multiple sugar transport system ATP-binding protein
VVEDLGSDAHVFFHVDAPPITAEILESAADSSLLTADRALFTARVDPRSSARPGRGLSLAVDPSRFHFFDPESGDRLAAAVPELQTAR